jgi:hypothetical protein
VHEEIGMPFNDKSVEVLRRRRKESAFYFVVLTLATGYVFKVHFGDGYPVPHFWFLVLSAAFALYSVAALVKGYHR